MKLLLFCGQASFTNIALERFASNISKRMSHVDHIILNISQKSIFTHEIELLKRGLKFTKTPKNKNVDVIKDTE